MKNTVKAQIALWGRFVLVFVTLFSVEMQFGSATSFAQSPELSPAPASVGEAASTQAAPAQARAGLQIDPTDREAAIAFYNLYYRLPPGVELEWSGSHAECNPGATNESFRRAVLRRINYFRAMAGVPADIVFAEEYNQKAQAAALMMSVNNALAHSPPTGWACYSAAGADAAGSSNLFLHVVSPQAIDGYMQDPGGGVNQVVPHRRWLLYPQTRSMGIGDIPAVDGYPAANVLWVIDPEHNFDPRPPTRDGYVAWPPPGYVPEELIFQRWSISLANADFANATVTMTMNGQPLPLTAIADDSGYGEPTITWEPDFGVMAANLAAMSGDSGLAINLSNITVDGESQSIGYELTVFAPPPAQPLTPRVYVPMVLK